MSGVIGSFISYMFDLVGVAVSILIFFMFLDYVTGLIAAGINGQLNSRVGLNGFARKIYILILVSAIYALEFVGVHYAEFNILGGHIGDGVAFSYIAVELISITENGVKINAPMPGFLKNIVSIAKDKISDNEGK